MVVMRIAVLCGLGAALGGCLSPAQTSTSYTALTYRDRAPKAVLNAPLPAVVEPGQPLRSGLGRNSSGVNPIAELSASERARAAWEPQRPSELALHSRPLVHAANAPRLGNAPDPSSTASVSPRAKSGASRSAGEGTYDALAAMDNLERSGQRAAKPICSGC